MSPQNLVLGKAYYRLTFADAAMTIPGVEPMIYIGANIFADDVATTPRHYFQDTVSYHRFGDATKYSGPEIPANCGFMTFPFESIEIGTSLLDLAGAIEA